MEVKQFFVSIAKLLTCANRSLVSACYMGSVLKGKFYTSLTIEAPADCPKIKVVA